MPAIDVNQLVQNISNAMTDILDTDVKLLRGYSKAKAQTIARFTALIGDGYASGEIGEAELAQEIDELDHMVERFVRNIKALANTTIERLIKAVTGTLYSAIRGAAAGAGVPLPALDLPDD